MNGSAAGCRCGLASFELVSAADAASGWALCRKPGNDCCEIGETSKARCMQVRQMSVEQRGYSLPKTAVAEAVWQSANDSAAATKAADETGLTEASAKQDAAGS